MILRKPYAFFIKNFKLIHVVLAFFSAFLIYKTGLIVNFFNDYLNSTTSVVGQEIVENLFDSSMILIPALMIVLCSVILGIMFKKEKPLLFYFVSILTFVVILVLTIYSRSFVTSMETYVMNIKAVKLTHDLLVISILLESFSFIIFFTRGLGLNFKKFDFSSDIINIDINEKDKEEVELSLNVDINKKRRKNKKNIRYFKYYYLENKFLINLILVLMFLVSGFIAYYRLFVFKDYYNEGEVVNSSGVNISVENSYILQATKENYLLAIDLKVNTIFKEKSLFVDDLYLKVENYKILSTNKYCEQYTDLGICYKGENLPNEFTNYLIFYEVPKIYYNDDMKFEYITLTDRIKFKINPIKFTETPKEKVLNLTEKISFEEKSLKDISFIINSFKFSLKETINYTYCYKANDCMESIEYLQPTVDSNYDKVVLKLSLNYNGNNIYNNFYDFFEKYGSITYKIEGVEYTQKSGFEQLKSKKKSENNVVYISVISDVLKANEVSIDFDVRNKKYKYILKGE